MTPLSSISLAKNCLVSALLSAALAAGCCYFVQQRRAHEAASLRAANQEMRTHIAQREPKPAAARPAAAGPQGLASNAATRVVAASSTHQNTAPVNDYREEGQATPIATLQTFAWACDRGDVDTVAKLICFDPAARTKAEAFMAALPPAARAHFASVEQMAATMLTGGHLNLPFPPARLLEKATEIPINEERVVLRLPGTTREHTEYQKTPDGWKYAITEAAVDAYIARVTAEAARPR